MKTSKSFPTKRSDQVRSRHLFALKLALGISLLSFLLSHYDLGLIFQSLLREPPTLFGATVLLFVATQLLSAFRWQLLARLSGIGGRFRDYVTYFFIGMFTNLFVPGLIGGDALRSLYLGRHQNRIPEAVGSVLADRGIGLLTLFCFAAVAALCVREIHLPETVLQLTISAGVISVIIYVIGPLLAKMFSRIGHLNWLIRPLIPYLSKPVSLVPAIILSGLLQFSLAICQYLLGWGLGIAVSLKTFLLVVPIANVVASLPITINGLGLREASYLMLFRKAGISKEKAVALSLIYFAATLIGGVTGIIPFLVSSISDVVPASSDYSSNPQ